MCSSDLERLVVENNKAMKRDRLVDENPFFVPTLHGFPLLPGSDRQKEGERQTNRQTAESLILQACTVLRNLERDRG